LYRYDNEHPLHADDHSFRRNFHRTKPLLYSTHTQQQLAMPSDVVKQLLESIDAPAEEPVVSRPSKKRKLKPEKPCSEDTLIKAHIHSLLAIDRKLAVRNKSSQQLLRRDIASKQTLSKTSKKLKKQPASCLVGRTAASQASIAHPPTSNKRQHAKERKKKQLRDIAKLLKKNQS
jgi:hypothetical protein